MAAGSGDGVVSTRVIPMEVMVEAKRIDELPVFDLSEALHLRLVSLNSIELDFKKKADLRHPIFK